MRKIILLAAMAACVSGCMCFKTCAARRLPEGSVLLDVRGKQEYELAHIKGAVNIPHTQVAEKIGSLVKNKSTPVFIYCRSGKRADIARKSMEKLGYTNIINLGGFSDASKVLE